MMPPMVPIKETGLVISNEPIATDIYRITLSAPQTARGLEPGQFVHLLLPAFEAHILRRPISVFGVDCKQGMLDVVYQDVGKGTHRLSLVEQREPLDIVGPLGRGWAPPSKVENVLLVAGGVGIAPLFMLANNLASNAQVDLVVGAQARDRLVPVHGLDDRIVAHPVTDDGSFGRKGFTTLVARELLEQGHFDYIATCGPEPMQKKVVELAEEFSVPCEVSLERRMGCGIGVCLSCVVDTVEGKKRACVDGPVFDARKVVWQ